MRAQVYDMSGRRWSESEAGQRDWRAEVEQRVERWRAARGEAQAQQHLEEPRRFGRAQVLSAVAIAGVMFGLRALAERRPVAALALSLALLAVAMVATIRAAWRAGRSR